MSSSLPPALGSPDPYNTANARVGRALLQQLNIGERTNLSPEMTSFLALCFLYYLLQLIREHSRFQSQETDTSCTEAGSSEELQQMIPQKNATKAEVDKEKSASISASRSASRSASEQASETQSLIVMVAVMILLVRLRLRCDLEYSVPSLFLAQIYCFIVIACYTHAFVGNVFYCHDSDRLVLLRRVLTILSILTIYVGVGILFFTLINQGKTEQAK